MFKNYVSYRLPEQEKKLKDEVAVNKFYSGSAKLETLKMESIIGLHHLNY